MTEVPVRLDCRGAALIGVLHKPARGARRGVVIVVGGSQYRIGSHRQFVALARDLAAAGFPVLSFDHRGIGDSDGPFRGFEHLDDDIRCAVDGLTARVPEVEEIVLWGLCDGASAICFYAATDPRVGGIVLVNPWIRTNQTLARAYMKQHYGARLRDPAMWRGLVTGRVNAVRFAASALGTIGAALGIGGSGPPDVPSKGNAANAAGKPYTERMVEGLACFNGPTLLILSGRDLLATEFDLLVAASRPWRRIMNSPQLTRHDLPLANHTYSRREWRDQVHQWTINWLSGLDNGI